MVISLRCFIARHFLEKTDVIDVNKLSCTYILELMKKKGTLAQVGYATWAGI